MDPLTISIIIGLIVSFLAKKKGASTAEAALAGVAAGAGTYYVTTETDWGKSLIGNVDKPWVQATSANGTPMVGPDGKPVMIPPGSVPLLDAAGNVVKDASGNWWKTAVGGATDVLTSWGPAGTAGVIGTVAVATDSNLKKYLPFAIGAVLLLLVMR